MVFVSGAARDDGNGGDRLTVRQQLLALGIAVVVATFSCGWPGLDNGFINFDDPDVIIDNPRLDQPDVVDVVDVFFEVRDHAYLPLYYLALMPEASFGKDPGGFHAASLVWHALCGLLVLCFVHALTDRAFLAGAAALLYVCHPIAVESVAWASGRKDQVSLALLLAGLTVWTAWLRRGGRGRLASAAALLFLGCFAKGTVVVFPLLAGMIWLMERRRSPGVASLRPVGGALALLSLLAAVPTGVHLWVALTEGTAGAGATHGVAEGAGLFLTALSGYAQHLAVPVRLSIHYYLAPGEAFGIGHATGVLVLAALVAGLIVHLFGKGGVLAFALGWVLVSLLPFNNVFPRTSVAMADRYLAVGLPAFALLVAGLIDCMPGRLKVVVLIIACGLTGSLTWRRTTEFENGEVVFRRAMEIAADDPVPPAMVAEALLAGRDALDKRQEAIGLMGRSLGLAERTGDPVRIMRARMRLADTQLRGGDFEDAQAQFERARVAFSQTPERFEALGIEPLVLDHNLAQCLIGRGLIQDGKAMLLRILTADPKHPYARLSHAGLEMQQGYVDLVRYEDAGLRHRARGRVDGGLEVLQALAKDLALREHAGVRVELEPEVLRQLGDATLAADWQDGNLMASLTYAETLIARHPGKPHGYSLRARVQERLLGPDGVRDVLLDLTKAHLLDPDDPNLVVRFAQQLRVVGENRKAHRVLDRAHARRPRSEAIKLALADLLVAQGRTHHNAGRHDKALLAAEGARRLIADSTEIWLLLAQVHEKNAAWEKAEAAYSQVLALDETHKEARLGMARFHQARGIGRLSELKARVGREADPDKREKLERDEMMRVLADYRVALEFAAGARDVEIARQYLRRRRAGGGDRSRELRTQGERELQAGDIEVGIELLRNAIRVDGLDAEARWMLAQALRARSLKRVDDERRADRDEALRQVERALSLDPEHLPSLYLASDLYYVKGGWSELRTVSRRFLLLTREVDALASERAEVERRLAHAERR